MNNNTDLYEAPDQHQVARADMIQSHQEVVGGEQNAGHESQENSCTVTLFTGVHFDFELIYQLMFCIY